MSDSNDPKHIGFILDGNRRWAKDNGLPKLEGHRRGFENLERIGEAAIDRGVEYMSAFVFSTENWKRGQEEVKYLMDMALDVAKNKAARLIEKGIRVRFMGSREGVRQDILDAADQAEENSKNNTRGTLALCFNYGGHLEIVEAVQKAAKAGVDISQIDSDKLQQYLYAPDVPPVDLLIRTSGEKRLSNFMLWRVAYSELYFVDKHWPDFNESDLDQAIEEYKNRNRRFGGN